MSLITSTLEVARDSSTATFDEADGTVEIDKSSQLGRNERADTFDMGDPQTLAARRGGKLAIEHRLALIETNPPLFLALGCTKCCTCHLHLPISHSNYNHY